MNRLGKWKPGARRQASTAAARDRPLRLSELLRRWPFIRGRPAVLIRRGLAAVLFLVAGVLAALPAGASGEAGTSTVVTAHDLAAGSRLGPPDLRIVSLPDRLRPSGALGSVDAAVGRLLTGAARAGEPVTDARLVGPRPDLPGVGDPRSAIVPVRLADPGVADLLRPGMRVDVVALAEAGASREVLAEQAGVVTVTAPDAEGRHGPATADKGPLVLITVPVDRAARVAAISLGQPVTVTLR